ncbi:hypothetical protein SAMN05444166_6300 [Singulisphaera sp. GP187]|uniref:hypothetical protein n=1 Tax=Singulisphaera sp. GP187 TaxID=1882752 RepID=UPI0009299F60|nr:hypothetical protein [Singulisphaera sp. GP187]SIO60189.1 hypothetical protein SAMN05444166_6300 [Singulisphaera sp. GP187]
MNHLEPLLRGINEKTLVSLETLTEPRMTKKSDAGDPNPFTGRLRKRTRMDCYLGSNYAKEVNERREREGKPADFVSKPRAWGKAIEATPLIEHKEELYLEYLVDQVHQVNYEVDGFIVPESLVEPWLVDGSKSSRQGLENQAIIRTAKLANVVDVQIQ